MRSVRLCETRFQAPKVASKPIVKMAAVRKRTGRTSARAADAGKMNALRNKNTSAAWGGSGPSASPSLSDCGNHFIRAHHFIVLVFEDVAVPHIASGETIKGHNDPRDHSGMGLYGIFPAGLIRAGRFRRSQ